jgi:DNA-damage-inducible protein J
MSKDSTIYTRIDEKDKNAFEHFVKSFGLSTSQAIRIFVKQTLMLNAFPFQIGIPNKETKRAFKEGEDSKTLSSYSSFKKLRKELDV